MFSFLIYHFMIIISQNNLNSIFYYKLIIKFFIFSIISCNYFFHFYFTLYQNINFSFNINNLSSLLCSKKITTNNKKSHHTKHKFSMIAFLISLFIKILSFFYYILYRNISFSCNISILIRRHSKRFFKHSRKIIRIFKPYLISNRIHCFTRFY